MSERAFPKFPTLPKCDKHPDVSLSEATYPPLVCYKCRREEQLKWCAQGHHHMGPAHNGERRCIGCFKTVSEDEFFLEAIQSLHK